MQKLTGLSRQLVISVAPSLAGVHEGEIASEVAAESLLTLMFVREKGMGIAVCSISCGSQAGLGSLFPFTDSTSR